jgi:hypothetical protein
VARLSWWQHWAVIAEAISAAPLSLAHRAQHGLESIGGRGVKRLRPNVKFPFVMRRGGGLVNIEAGADRRFRDALLTLAPEGPRKQFRDAFLNGPKVDGRRHAIEYFGKELPAILALTIPLVETIHVVLATRGADGFNEWITATGFADDYRFIKGLHEWALWRSGT